MTGTGASRRAALRTRRIIVALLLGLAVTPMLAGCSAGLSDTGAPLTIAQAEQLAGSRFALYAKGPFTAVVSYLPDDDVDHIAARLTVDPETHRAWGTLERGPEGLAVSTPVLVAPGGLAVDQGGAWRPADAQAGARLAVQGVFLLVADRPENAQLLRQSDAVHLGSADENGETLDVYRLPSSADDAGASWTGAQSRIWLTADGEMRRVDSGEGGALEIVLTGDEPVEAPRGAEEVWRAIGG
ncbi:hypothetical protein [Microbacterium sp. No. 7]|uniref:hypothetical protein n=1 Tax=Microbacterium sp. No. 7 TaxID=1714373 RepID=UPI0006D26983|nr:hypothetical protein [Microbacterium sp. No. 7]ALJ21359.1 hypothetical protein AOA12_16195 [Microbacterium sp. No. 7]